MLTKVSVSASDFRICKFDFTFSNQVNEKLTGSKIHLTFIHVLNRSQNNDLKYIFYTNESVIFQIFPMFQNWRERGSVASLNPTTELSFDSANNVTPLKMQNIESIKIFCILNKLDT